MWQTLSDLKIFGRNNMWGKKKGVEVGGKESQCHHYQQE